MYFNVSMTDLDYLVLVGIEMYLLSKNSNGKHSVGLVIEWVNSVVV